MKAHNFSSIDPATGDVVWSGRAATAAGVDQAVRAARRAFDDWADTTLAHRTEVLHAFGEQLRAGRGGLARTISRETGKPGWESESEVDLMIAKIGVSADAYAQRRATERIEVPGSTGVTRYRPHGVVAVLGPFNLPGHLPNGHLVPALLAGNTAVFKPSELTPGVGQEMVELWRQAGLPDGVINLVQGGREAGEALTTHGGVDGIFFTGSYATGRAINRSLADRPEKILALEMGGNNPLVVHAVGDLDAAAYLTVLSAYITAGQRCTCARRLIVADGVAGDRFLDRLCHLVKRIEVGRYDADPFMGPVINDRAAYRLMAAQADLIGHGGRVLVQMTQSPDHRAMLRPGLIDVSGVDNREDEEWFGPLLQVLRVRDFEAAIEEADRTAYGLSAALFSDDEELFQQFYRQIRAGVINWNRQTTGASGRLPFGGVGRSGNHRPSGFWAADYCSFPITSLESKELSMPEKRPPGLPAIVPGAGADG